MDEDQLERTDDPVLGAVTRTSSSAPRSSSRGLDVPNANTLIVDRADHPRSRPALPAPRPRGPSAERAFAYFFFPRATRDDRGGACSASRRSSKHQALGSRFKIAMRDLEIRGAGNLLGAEQSGHIAAVGFDAYARYPPGIGPELQGDARSNSRRSSGSISSEGVRPSGLAGTGIPSSGAVSADRDRARPRGLAMIRDETLDRLRRAPGPGRRSCSRSASLRLTAARLGVRGSRRRTGRSGSGSPSSRSTLSLVDLPDGPGATYQRRSERSTWSPSVIFGADLVRWVEARLRQAVGEPAGPGLAFPTRSGPPRKLVQDASLSPSRVRSPIVRPCASRSSSRPRAPTAARSPPPPPSPGPRSPTDELARTAGVFDSSPACNSGPADNRTAPPTRGGGVQPVLARRDDPVPARRHDYASKTASPSSTRQVRRRFDGLPEAQSAPTRLHAQLTRTA